MRRKITGRNTLGCIEITLMSRVHGTDRQKRTQQHGLSRRSKRRLRIINSVHERNPLSMLQGSIIPHHHTAVAEITQVETGHGRHQSRPNSHMQAKRYKTEEYVRCAGRCFVIFFYISVPVTPIRSLRCFSARHH